jgi:hypothetical protein
MEFLRGQQGEPVVEVVTALGAEDADGTCACTVTFLCAFCQDAVEDVKILFHLQFNYLQSTIYLAIG